MNKNILRDNSIYFLIFGTHKKFPLFSSNKICDLLRENIFFYKNKYKFELIAYSIVPCHLNLYARFNKKEDIKNFERDYKSYTANELLKKINLINDYEFICGQKCGCKKFSNYLIDDNRGAPHPRLSSGSPCRRPSCSMHSESHSIHPGSIKSAPDITRGAPRVMSLFKKKAKYLAKLSK